MQATEKIWMNGELVDWDDAKIHVGVHGLHYGTGVFEGIRCYDTPKGPAVFRLDEHLERLVNSARLLYMELPYSRRGAARRVHGAASASNGLPSCYLRPLAFYGYGELGVAARDNPVDVVIMSWPWGTYLGDDGLRNGIRAKVSSWQRVGPNVIPHVAKATGIYLNSMLAVTEANNAGYDEAIMLTHDGYVADGSGENIFVVKDGVLYTPDLAAGSCPGITRNTMIQIAQDLGYTVVEKNLIRSDLHIADEVFMCGTAAEVTPIRDGRRRSRSASGAITMAIQKAYLDDRATARATAGRTGASPVENFAPRRGVTPGDKARSGSPRPGSTSATRSSCSRRCARAGSRSGRPGRASRSCSPRRRARRTAPRSRAARRGCTSRCGSRASGPATR